MENNSLRLRIQTDRRAAKTNAQDQLTPSVLDAVWAEVEKAEKAPKRAQAELADPEMLAVLSRVSKQFTESRDAFALAASKETDESRRRERDAQRLILDAKIHVLSQYLPTLMSPEEIRAALLDILGPDPVKDPKLQGKFIGAFNQKFPKRADNNVVRQILGELLAA